MITRTVDTYLTCEASNDKICERLEADDRRVPRLALVITISLECGRRAHIDHFGALREICKCVTLNVDITYPQHNRPAKNRVERGDVVELAKWEKKAG
jgi:hypothetical protein